MTGPDGDGADRSDGRNGEDGEPRREPLLAYVPEGYVIRKRVSAAAPGARPAPRSRVTLVVGITLTLVLGIVVGYLTGFAVARQQGDASVNVTVHQSTEGP